MKRWFRRLRRIMNPPINGLQPETRLGSCEAAVEVVLDREKRLTKTISDAQSLLSFSAQTNRKIDHHLIANLLSAIGAIESLIAEKKRIDTEAEIAFWTQYDALAVAVAPISAESIRQTEIAKTGRFKAIRLPLTAGFMALGFFVLIQAYGTAGADLLERQRAVQESNGRIFDKNQALLPRLERATAKLQTLENEDFQQISAPTGKGQLATTASVESLQAKEKKQLLQEIAELQSEMRRNSDELKRIQIDVRPVSKLLEHWYSPIPKLLGLVSLSESYKKMEEEIRENAKKRLAERSSAPYQARLLSLIAANRKASDETRLQADLDRLEGEKIRAVQTMASIILRPLNQYVLPALLGILGAMTYVLRSISAQLTQFTYLPLPPGITMARITLGMIAGVMGSIAFSSAGGDAAFKTLSPLIAPFLFGYAVDVFFALLDKLVTTFTSNSSIGPGSK